MATSDALSTSNQYIKYKITITSNSQSVTGNTSNVTVSVRFYRTNTGYTTYGTGTVYCKINGTTYSASVTPDDKITSGGIVLFTKTLNIPHNSDGSKTLTVSAWISHESVTSTEQSYSVQLETIPRTSGVSIDLASVDMGQNIVISISRASTAFTHTLKYTFAGASGTIGTGVATSKTWAVPLSLASKIPNATSGILTVTCETYNGSVRIGAKTDTVTVKVPASVVPTIGNVAITDAVSGINAKFGAFVANKSKLSVAITASGAYSSTIKTYSSKILGITYTGSTFTTGVISTVGAVPVAVTVTDSRGRKATTTKSITVLDYQTPTIEAFSVIRCNADGSDNTDGDYARIVYRFEISPVNNLNDKSFKLSYKLQSDTTYTDLKSGSVYADDSIYVPVVVFNGDNSYNMKLTISDYFKTVTHTVELPTAFTLVDYHSSGKGLAVGKVAESENLLDVSLPARFRNGADIESPWVNLTLNATQFNLYNDSSTPRFKAVGGMVSIIGAVTPKTDIPGSSTIYTIASGIPAKYRPPITLNFLCQGTNMNRWLCQVTSSGEVTFSRYGMTSYATCAVSNWLPFALSYAVV